MLLEFNKKGMKVYAGRVGVTYKIPLPQLPKAGSTGVRSLDCSSRVIIHAGLSRKGAGYP